MLWSWQRRWVSMPFRTVLFLYKVIHWRLPYQAVLLMWGPLITVRNNFPDFSSQCLHLRSQVPPWWVGPACRDQNDHQSLGSWKACVSDTSLCKCSHEWYTFYSGFLLIFIISKWLNVMFMFTCLNLHCLLLVIWSYSGQQFRVKDVSSILKQKAPIPRKEPVSTHTQSGSDHSCQ